MDSRAGAVALARGEIQSPSSSTAGNSVLPAAAAPVAPRVLVVDDEPLFGTFVARALRSAGYEVYEANTPEQALQLLAGREVEFSLLLSDVGLPRLLGPELVRRARAIIPALPALLMSGDSKDALVRRGVLAPSTELLEKPFSLSALFTKIERLLDHTPRSDEAR